MAVTKKPRAVRAVAKKKQAAARKTAGKTSAPLIPTEQKKTYNKMIKAGMSPAQAEVFAKHAGRGFKPAKKKTTTRKPTAKNVARKKNTSN